MPTLEPEKLDSSSPPKPKKRDPVKNPVKNPVKTKSEETISLPLEKIRRAARVLMAMSDAEATRTKILYLLSRGACTPGYLASALKISNSAVSQHLCKMKDMDILRSVVSAQSRIYSLVPGLSEETMELVKLILNRK